MHTYIMYVHHVAHVKYAMCKMVTRAPYRKSIYWLEARQCIVYKLSAN